MTKKEIDGGERMATWENGPTSADVRERTRARRIFRASALLLLASLALAGLAACSSSPAANDACVGGKACSCADCARTCGGGGASCTFECTGGSCSFSCPGGNCEATGTGAASVSLDCAGGGCSLTSTRTSASALSCAGGGCQHTCSGARSCRTLECRVGCQTTCGGATTCESSCTATSGGCEGPGGDAPGGSLGNVPGAGSLFDGGVL